MEYLAQIMAQALVNQRRLQILVPVRKYSIGPGQPSQGWRTLRTKTGCWGPETLNATPKTEGKTISFTDVVVIAMFKHQFSKHIQEAEEKLIYVDEGIMITDTTCKVDLIKMLKHMLLECEMCVKFMKKYADDVLVEPPSGSKVHGWEDPEEGTVHQKAQEKIQRANQTQTHYLSCTVEQCHTCQSDIFF